MAQDDKTIITKGSTKKYYDYTYVNNTGHDVSEKETIINFDYLDELERTHSYETALNYLNNFQSSDNNQFGRELRRKKNEYKELARKYKTRYNNASYEELDQIEFADNIFRGNPLLTTDSPDRIIINGQSNTYQLEYNKLLDSLGEDIESKKGANVLAIKFKNNNVITGLKQGISALFTSGMDLSRASAYLEQINKENNNKTLSEQYFNNFIKKLGYDKIEDFVKDTNCKYQYNKDGTYEFYISKNNENIHKILANLNIEDIEIYGGNAANDTDTKTNILWNDNPTITIGGGLQIVRRFNNNLDILNKIQDKINDAIETRDSFWTSDYEEDEDNLITRSSYVMPYIPEGKEEYAKQKDLGLIGEEQYKVLVEKLGDPDIMIRDFPFATSEFYSNYGDEDIENLKPVDVDKKVEIGRILTNYIANNPNLVGKEYMVNGDKYGMVFTINPKDIQSKNSLTDLKKPFKVFIPGFMAEQAQAALKQDTRLRAKLELEDMRLMNYAYTTRDGDTYHYDQGVLLKNGQIANNDNAVIDIDKDMALDDLEDLQYKYTNARGAVDLKGYNEEAKKRAYQAALALYDNEYIRDEEGTPYTLTDLFNYAPISKDGQVDLDALVNNDFSNHLYTIDALKYKATLEIYQELLNMIRHRNIYDSSENKDKFKSTYQDPTKQKK